MKIEKDELLWKFLNEVPNRFLNVDQHTSHVQIVKRLPGRFIKTPRKCDNSAVLNVIQDHRVPIRFIKCWFVPCQNVHKLLSLRLCIRQYQIILFNDYSFISLNWWIFPCFLSPRERPTPPVWCIRIRTVVWPSLCRCGPALSNKPSVTRTQQGNLKIQLISLANSLSTAPSFIWRVTCLLLVKRNNEKVCKYPGCVAQIRLTVLAVT